MTALDTLDADQLRAELEKAKKRTKELATENVDYEDKVKELTKELEEAKKSKARFFYPPSFLPSANMNYLVLDPFHQKKRLNYARK